MCALRSGDSAEAWLRWLRQALVLPIESGRCAGPGSCIEGREFVPLDEELVASRRASRNAPRELGLGEMAERWLASFTGGGVLPGFVTAGPMGLAADRIATLVLVRAVQVEGGAGCSQR